jgi:hypothetical protein
MTTALIGAGALVAAGPASAATTANLIKNPGAEAVKNHAPTVAPWMATTGVGARVVKYGASGFPAKSSLGGKPGQQDRFR